MKSTESGFVGYPKDKYTTLKETEDRILATDISTKWRYNTAEVDYNAVYDSVKQTMLTEFSQGYSLALQQDLYDMAAAVIDQHPQIDEIKFSCPTSTTSSPTWLVLGSRTRTRCSTPPTGPTA